MPEDFVAVKNVPHTILEMEVLGFFLVEKTTRKHDSVAFLCSGGATLKFNVSSVAHAP